MGASSPFSIAWFLLLAFVEGRGDFLASLLEGLFYGGLGMVLLAFSIVFLVDSEHHRIWGPVVLVGYAFTSFLVLAVFGEEFLYSPYNISLSYTLLVLGLTAGPALGIVGGLMGFFRKTPRGMGPLIPSLAEPARLGLTGGLVGLILSLLFFTLPFFPPALLVVVSSLLLYKGRWKARYLGVLIVVGSLGAVLFALFIIVELAASSALSPFTLLGIISLFGAAVAMIGGLQSIRWKETMPLIPSTGASS